MPASFSRREKPGVETLFVGLPGMPDPEFRPSLPVAQVGNFRAPAHPGVPNR